MSGNNISVIVFDLGNVLLPFDYTPLIEGLNKVDKGLGEKFFEFYKANYEYHRDFERGDMDEERFIELMLKSIENKVEKKAFCKLYSEIFKVNEDVAALIPKLKKNYKVCLLSNTNSIHREYGYKQHEFLTYFDKLFLSYEINAIKPEEKIYRIVEKYTQKPSSEHIFIDDVLEYVEGAKKAGWDGIQFLGYDNLIEELKKRDIKF